MALGSYATTRQLGEYLRDVGPATNAGLWAELLDRASRFIDDQTGWFFYQLASTTYLVDGSDTDVIIPNIPIVSVSLLESQYYTGATWNTIAAGQYFLYPSLPSQGWPYTYIRLTDIPTTGQSTKFWRGKQNVRITAVAGFPAVPSAITHLTLKLAARIWKARDTGFAGVVGSVDTGILTVKDLDSTDKYTLATYTRPSL